MADASNDPPIPTEDGEIVVEDFMKQHIAPHLPTNRSGVQYTVFWRCIGLELTDTKKKPISLPKVGSCHKPKLPLKTIEATHDYNNFNLNPLKTHVKANQRAYAWHLQHIPNLIVFDIDHIPDFDDPRIPDYLTEKLPHTVSFSGNGYHFYAFCEDLPASNSEQHGFPRDPVECLLNPDTQEIIGDFFVPSHQYKVDDVTGQKSQAQTIWERPSLKGQPVFVHNFNGAIPVLPYAEIEPMLNREKLFKKQKTPEELLREQRKAEKQSKYQPLETEDDDIARGFSADDVMFMLERINPNRKRSDGWLQVGAFLHNKCDAQNERTEYPCFEDGFHVWDVWSKGDTNGPFGKAKKYDASTIEGTYIGLTRDEVGFGTLVTYASQDSDAEEVKAYLTERFAKATKHISCEYTQTNCAQIMRFHMRDLLSDSKQTNLKKKLFEINTGGIWTATDDGLVSNKMILALLPEMKKTRQEIVEELKAVDDDDEELQERWEMKKILVQKAITNIQSETFQENVFKQMCKLDVYKSQDGTVLSDIWNQQENIMFIVPFNNVVYDLKQSLWRSALPLEYVSVTTGYDWSMRNGNLLMPTQEELEFVWHTLSEIFLTENQMRWWMTVVAANLTAQNFFREIYFLVGNAANGKGLFFDLLENTFGACKPGGGSGLFGTMDPAFFQERGNKVGSVAPAVANLRHCRFVTSSEPDKDKSWRADLLKRWNGDDVIECRDLYSSGNNFPCQFGLWFQMNDIPVVNNPKDPGVRR
eukprot:SAG11_NODE_3052_length_2726_cov_17.997716_1_plen_755_part_10